MKKLTLILMSFVLLSLAATSFAEDAVCIQNNSFALLKACNLQYEQCKQIWNLGFTTTRKLNPGVIDITYMDKDFRWKPVVNQSLSAKDTITITGNILQDDDGVVNLHYSVTHNTCN